MDEVYKFHVMKKWDNEIKFMAKRLCTFMKELHTLKYYDVEIWERIAKDAVNQIKLNNIENFVSFH